MKQRKTYWRRKNKKIIAEGKRKNKTTYLFQLPSIEKVINSNIFTPKKMTEIQEKYKTLDIKPMIKHKRRKQKFA